MGGADGAMHGCYIWLYDAMVHLQAWFTPPKTNGLWVQALAENNAVFMYTLKLTPEVGTMQT